MEEISNKWANRVFFQLIKKIVQVELTRVFYHEKATYIFLLGNNVRIDIDNFEMSIMSGLNWVGVKYYFTS